MRGPVAEFARGVACFARGQLLILRRPGLAGWALLPPLVVSLLLFAAILVLATYAEAIVAWATPFANGWDPMLVQAGRWVVAVAVVLAAVYVAVRIFAVVTLTLGRPAYARIQRRVDRLCGGARPSAPPAPGPAGGVVAELVRGVARSLVSGAAVFGIGLLPVVGSVAAPVSGALLGAGAITGELAEPAFSARGLDRDEHRRAAIKAHRASALGFGLLAYVALLVPFVGVALFPGAVAGATLLTREWHGEPTQLG